MKKRKIFFLCVIVLLISLCFVSCKGEKTPSVTEAPLVQAPDATETPGSEIPEVTEAPDAQKLISAEALKEYTIVAPLTAGVLYNDAVSLIYNSIIEKCGATLKMSDDFLMGDAKPSGKEIVLGNASRDFVVDEFLAYDSYHIYFSGDNIVINGGSTSAIEAGAALFVSLLNEGGLTMKEEGYLKATEYPLGNLKINGKYINEYKIITKGKTYGAKYAAEHLQKKLLELTGFELKISSGKSATAIYLDGIDSNDGMYHIESEGSTVTLYGTGMSGACTAVNALLEMIGDEEDVTVTGKSAPMFTLNNTKKKLADGKLSIAFLGDSVMAGAGDNRPLCEFFTDLIKAEYSDADIRMKNRSIGGKNTMWGLYCLEDELLAQGYSDLFFISLGGNDLPYGASYEEIAINYQSMIEKIYKNNPETEIVFIAYGRINEVKNVSEGKENRFMKAMLDVANYYGLPVVDMNVPLYNLCMEGDFDEIWSKYIYDTVHANVVGQELYGNILWQSVDVAIKESEGASFETAYMPTEPMFKNSKKDTVLESWADFSKEIVFGTGEEAGWGRTGTVTKSGASISFDFEGVGLEIGITHNKTNPFFLLIQIYDENGEIVLEREWDSGYYYHLFITNELEYGKYTLKLTTTKPSERYPSEDGQTLTMNSRMIIK